MSPAVSLQSCWLLFFYLAERTVGEAELQRSGDPVLALLFTLYIMGMGKVSLAIVIAKLGLLLKVCFVLFCLPFLGLPEQCENGCSPTILPP